MAKTKETAYFDSGKEVSDFSVVEDSGKIGYLVKIGILAGQGAVKENRALGLPNTFVKDGSVFAEDANGESKVIAKLELNPKRSGHKKGAILHVKAR